MVGDLSSLSICAQLWALEFVLYAVDVSLQAGFLDCFADARNDDLQVIAQIFVIASVSDAIQPTKPS